MKSQVTTFPASPREKFRIHLRGEILKVARQAFARYGYEGVSMRMLADKIGCSHGNLYLHFRNKEEIFDCLIEQSFEQLATALRELYRKAGSSDCLDLLRKAARAYIDFGLRNPSAYEFAFILRRPGALNKPHQAYEYLRALVARCADEKRIRDLDIDTAAQAAWAAVHGVTSLLIFRPSFPWTDKNAVIERVIDDVVGGLERQARTK
jgi:AcrR family transcriptional regulator